MQLTWKASESATAMHAVHAAALGWAFTQAELADVLAPLVAEPPAAAFGDLASLTAMLLSQAAAGIEQNHALAESAIVKLRGRGAASDTQISSLAAWVSSVERCYYDWHRGHSSTPLVDEIVTRTAPLRDQWDARGPGMLRVVERLTASWLVAERANVVMLQPVLGGHGDAHLPVNVVTLEAVLTNPNPELPEAVRLVWLLGQLQFDLPAVAEQLAGAKVPHLARVAMLAPALAAAEEVELARLGEADIAAAALEWRVASTPDEADRMARTTWQWWTTYQSGRVTWPAAVAALCEMLDAAGRS